VANLAGLDPVPQMTAANRLKTTISRAARMIRILSKIFMMLS
jgi:hypothetical protein